MNKKTLTKLLSVCLCVPISFSLFSCDKQGGQVKTSFSDVGKKAPDVQVSSVREINVDIEEEREKDYYAPKFVFDYLGEDVMPIGAWNTPPEDYFQDEFFKDYSDAGLNFMLDALGINAQSPSVSTAIKLAEQNGIMYLTGDSHRDAFVDDLVMKKKTLSRVLSSVNFGGIVLQDEPGFEKFQLLAKAAKAYYGIDKNLLSFVNLLAISNEADTNGPVNHYRYGMNGAYEREEDTHYDYRTDYVDKFVQAFEEQGVKPGVIVYDFYPCIGTFPNVADGFFATLSEIADVSVKKGIPFWPYIQVCSWKNGYSRVCTQEEIDWQVNCSLVYGAKGFAYFMYWTKEDRGPEQYNGCMVSLTGEKQETYYSVRNTNKNLQKIGKYFLNSNFKGIIRVGDSPSGINIPERELILSNGVHPESGIYPVENKGNYLGSFGVPHLIGCFDYMGVNAYYAVCNSISEGGRLAMKFSDGKKYTVIYRGEEYETDGLITLGVKAGEGVLIIEKD